MDFRLDDEVVATFIEETTERLQEIETGVLYLEKHAPQVDPDLVHRIFRAAHSIKAGANLLKLQNIQDVAHRLEHILQRYRTGSLVPDEASINVLLQSLDTISYMANNLDRCDQLDISALMSRLNPYGEPDS